MQQGYTGPEVCKITGITYRQLDHWTTSKLISASECTGPSDIPKTA